ncbi:ProQ/FinO family protein [Nissabacter archeti]|uniref:ProQ/FinO family protein n=1 Tax=Nissabacter archeti TaxID=1917880 RepID=UPI0009A1E552|nr:ProQ/FinO family protein [Nissabacter archeti]
MKSRDQAPVIATERKKKNKPNILRTLAPDDALSKFFTYWPALFSKGEIKLLTLHIFADLHQEQIDRNLPFSGKQLRCCIKTYVLSPEYLHATKAGAVRYDIHDQPAGQVIDKEQAWAVKQLARITAQEADGMATQGPA